MVRRGVAMIDVLVATIILGVALAVILGIVSRALDARARGEELRDAAMLIDEQLNLVLARGPDDYGREFPTEGRCDPPFEEYEFELEIGSGGAGDAYLVTATVSWSSAGRRRAEKVSTLMAPRIGDDPDPIRVPAQIVDREF